MTPRLAGLLPEEASAVEMLPAVISSAASRLFFQGFSYGPPASFRRSEIWAPALEVVYSRLPVAYPGTGFGNHVWILFMDLSRGHNTTTFENLMSVLYLAPLSLLTVQKGACSIRYTPSMSLRLQDIITLIKPYENPYHLYSSDTQTCHAYTSRSSPRIQILE